MPDAHTIAVTTHGRYLVHGVAAAAPWLLAGFHGYGEDAETQLERMRAIPGSGAGVIVSVQGLHRFYRRRSQEVVSSWMTRQDRELAIADNTAYAGAVIAAISPRLAAAAPIVFAGFSQGAAMAYRAACAMASTRPCGVIVLGGDLPPELDRASPLSGLRGVLLGRGEKDPWYSAAAADHDAARLCEANVPVTRLTLDAAHEWTGAFGDAAGRFIASLIAMEGAGQPASR